MSKYLVITDSTADFTPEQIEQLGIEVIPMEFLMEDKTYLNYPDGREMTNEQFYAAMRNGSMPTTTQITSARFVEIFEPHLKEETDLLYICFSSALSATYERSVTAVEELREKFPFSKYGRRSSCNSCIGNAEKWCFCERSGPVGRRKP